MKSKYLFLATIFYISFIFCQEDFDVDINNFYQPASNNPFITLDPSCNTCFIMDIYNPNILIDYEIIDIKVNSSTLSPMGTYRISPFYLGFVKDTISSTAFEHNRGDYGYYDNVIFLNNKYANHLSSFVMIQGRKYDGLQSINSNSDILQNYFLNITKHYPKLSKSNFYGSVSTSLMYHKENISIPVYNYGSYNRKSNSYLNGFSVIANYSNIFKFKTSLSSQLTRGNHYLGLNLDEYTHWVNSEIHFQINDNISVTSLFNNKQNAIQNTDYSKISLNQFFLMGKINYEKIFFDFGVSYHYTEMVNAMPRFNFYLGYKIKDFLSISLNKKTTSFINRNYIIIDNLIFDSQPINLIDRYSIKINYANKLFSLMAEPFYLNDYFYIGNEQTDINSDSNYKSKIRGLNASLSFNSNYIVGNIKSGFYESENSIPINFYANYSLIFSPKINNKRFRPFIGIDGTYMNLNSSSYIDMIFNNENNSLYPFINLSDLSIDSFDTPYIKNTSLINFKLGLILNRFKISYHWINQLDEQVLFSFSENYQSIAPFSKLQVTWQFLD